jgi:hypothetical protein
MVSSWPSVPLPTDYWTQPVSPMNREWWPILGCYPWTGVIYYPNGKVLYASNYKYTAYVQAPNTCHVVWRRQGNIGGLIGGGEAAIYSYTTGGGTPSIIYAGRCYQTLTKVMPTLVNGTYYNLPQSVWECYDLRTGQVYWDQTGITSAPTVVTYEPPPADIVPGSIASDQYSAYLVSIASRLIKYNAYTGAVVLNISLPTGITSGTLYNDPWVLSLQTTVARNNTSMGQGFMINWTIAGSSTNFTTRIGTNVTWPMNAQGTNGVRAVDYDAGLYVEGGWNSPDYGLYGGNEWFGGQVCIGYNIVSQDLYTG